MAELLTGASQAMRAASGFHSDNAGRQIVQNIQQAMPLKALAKYHRRRLVQPSEAANRLAQIYAQNPDVYRLLHSFANPETMTTPLKFQCELT